MKSEVQMIGYELIKTGSLVSFRIVEEEVLAAPDEAGTTGRVTGSGFRRDPRRQETRIHCRRSRRIELRL